MGWRRQQRNRSSGGGSARAIVKDGKASGENGGAQDYSPVIYKRFYIFTVIDSIIKIHGLQKFNHFGFGSPNFSI
jgi:hypothetical protein